MEYSKEDLGQFTRNYTQTVKRAADNKRRKWVFQFDRQAYCNQRGRE